MCTDSVLSNILLNEDFNVPDFNVPVWEDLTVRNNLYYYIQLNNTMLDLVNANSLTQLINEPTRDDNILDLALTTKDMEVYPGISDHCTVTYNVNISVKRQKKNQTDMSSNTRKGTLTV